MKKHLLLPMLITLLVMSFGLESFAQVTGPNKDLKLKQVKAHPDQISIKNLEAGVPENRSRDAIGSTVYDAQVVNYGNMMQRIWAYDDETVGATWIGMGFDNIPERGCGYNYFDNTAWGTPEPHVGPSDRMGTPSYAPWGENGEIISQYRYIAGEGPIRFYKRENKGTGDWTETELVGPSGVSLVWHSMITSGENNEYVHLLALTYDSPYMNQENALLYYRSSDGAETWDIDGVIIEGLGEDYLSTINSLSYAWSNPVGNTLAFTYGFDEFGGQIFKSYDNGDSWETIDVFTTPFSSLDPPTNTEDFACGIGSSAIALDSEGSAHVVFARMVKLFVDGNVSYYPFTDGLIYWNETMDVLDTTAISTYTFDFLIAGGNLIGWLEEPLDITEFQPNYANALWGFPQLSIDAENNIFVATSTLSNYDNGQFYYRHIFVNSSFNGGLSWEGQVDINDSPTYMFSECAFPAMAPFIDDKIHIVFQEDYFPGIHEWLEDHEQDDNQITALSFEKDFFVNIGEHYGESNIQLSDGFPNPANQNVSFSLHLDKATTININLTNIVGQTVKTKSINQLNAGSNTLSIDISDLISGTYFCTIEVDHEKFSRKIIVTR